MLLALSVSISVNSFPREVSDRVLRYVLLGPLRRRWYRFGFSDAWVVSGSGEVSMYLESQSERTLSKVETAVLTSCVNLCSTFL